VGDRASVPSGASGRQLVASAGEEVELECLVTGGNPPATIHWLIGDRRVQGGHTQENSRSTASTNAGVSVSRLALPVSREDNGATLRCIAEHPTLDPPLSDRASLVIHCKDFKWELPEFGR